VSDPNSDRAGMTARERAHVVANGLPYMGSVSMGRIAEDAIAAAIEAAEQAQLERDMQAMCSRCGNKLYEPALWDAEIDEYVHHPKPDHWVPMECDASPLLRAWAARHAPDAAAKGDDGK
jgi:hypothetical protein